MQILSKNNLRIFWDFILLKNKSTKLQVNFQGSYKKESLDR